MLIDMNNSHKILSTYLATKRDDFLKSHYSGVDEDLQELLRRFKARRDQQAQLFKCNVSFCFAII